MVWDILKGDQVPTLHNNRELYEYLGRLAGALDSAGQHDLEQVVTTAMGNASSLSTEFLGESRLALRRVLSDGGSALTSQERTDLVDVLAQLDQALERRA